MWATEANCGFSSRLPIHTVALGGRRSGGRARRREQAAKRMVRVTTVTVQKAVTPPSPCVPRVPIISERARIAKLVVALQSLGGLVRFRATFGPGALPRRS